MDYTGLVDFLTGLDDDHDCFLTETQFRFLLSKYQIRSDQLFIDTVFRGLKVAAEDKVSFGSIIFLYKSSFRGLKNKDMSIILFRGVDYEKKGYVNFDQYFKLEQIVNGNKVDKNKVFMKFKRNTVFNRDYLPYSRVSIMLFNTFMTTTFNPHEPKQILKYAITSKKF